MQNDMPSPSQEARQRYKVRQVTNYQASWTEVDRGEEGTFTLQLILDNGVILKLLKRSKQTTFDLERKVLMFSNIDAD